MVILPGQERARSRGRSFDKLRMTAAVSLILSLSKDDGEDDAVSFMDNGASDADEAADVDSLDGPLILPVELDDRRVASWSARGHASNYRLDAEIHKIGRVRSRPGWRGARTGASHDKAMEELGRGTTLVRGLGGTRRWGDVHRARPLAMIAERRGRHEAMAA